MVIIRLHRNGMNIVMKIFCGIEFLILQNSILLFAENRDVQNKIWPPLKMH